MTRTDLDAKVNDIVDGSLGKLFKTSAVAIVLGLSSWALKTTSDNGVALAEIRADLRNLVSAVDANNRSIDERYGMVIDAQKQVAKEVWDIRTTMATHQQELDDKARTMLPQRTEPN